MALEWLSIASVWFKKAKGFNLYYSNWLIVVTAIIEMEQFVWGLTSEALRHSDRIQREIRKNEVYTAPSTRRTTKGKIISVALSTRLGEPYSGKNLFWCVCLFQLVSG